MASPPRSSFPFLALKICFLLSSLLAFSLAVAYWHPFLLPLFTHTMPQLWMALQAWFTAPVLFVLMNLVVGAVFVSSRRVHRTPRRLDAHPADETDPREAEDLVDEKSFADGPEARLGKFSVRDRLPRLVRSKSDQILPPKPVDISASRLKKFASGSEATSRNKTHVGDSQEDDPASEEVDKKAEDFIGGFYQRLKLQRLDSLTRYQGWINRSHGPP